MKANRKVRITAVFFVCWFVILMGVVDGIIQFPTLVCLFGSPAITEIVLWAIVLVPTIGVFLCVKNPK